MNRFLAVLWLALIALAAPAAAQTFPQLTGRVVDQANLLSPAQEADLTAKSEALEKQTGSQFVVATVNSLEDEEIADYAYQLGRHWKIGDEKRDDGVILLVAPNERKVWIATGYGAEGFLPDILAGRITRQEILPRFREGDMAGGIVAGSDAIIQQMALSPEEAQKRADEVAAQERAREKEGAGFLPVIFWGMVIGFVLLGMARRVSGRRYRSRGKRKRRDGGFDSGDAAIILWGLSTLADSSRKGRSSGWGGGFGGWGGGGGGGFGGFSGGGGSFGGGGAGGSW